MAVVVSAPGKVLISGGYLVLERPNAGIALSTTARFYAIIRPLYEEVKPDSWAWAWTDIKLTSPQLSRESMFKLSLTNLGLQPASPSESRNPFVEQAVQYAAAVAHATFDENRKNELHKLLLKGLDITVLGSNDFYSYRNQIEAQNLPLIPESLAALSPFASITFNDETSDREKGKPEVAKTGLGSSAAMTTAVVAGLLHYFGVVDLSFTSQKITKESNVSTDLDIVHIIAQSAHCIAQGKVGSGFDVSAAVYGSQRYVRFSPEVLSSAQVAANALPLTEVILDILNGKWDHEITKFSLPPLMSLLLGEPGTGGSSTVSMVGAVKKWQKSDPQKAMETWKKLSEANKTLELHLNDLSTLAKEDWDMYKHVIHECSLRKSSKVDSIHEERFLSRSNGLVLQLEDAKSAVSSFSRAYSLFSIKSLEWTELVKVPGEETLVRALLKARDSMLEIRFHLRNMGVAAGVPIEPEAQTELLDATMDVAGVLLAGVPGAGGFDAVFAVTLGDASSNLTKAWSLHGVLAMLVREDPRGISLEAGDPRTLKITSNVSSLHIQ